ncbi:cell filamentation protein [Thiohalospira halophila DSM 15071]|uniref:Cell filamentation protein n=1 Tax=Thiohalospira halophila DSM 15071 TaxID=1123397 RepID=A0A1I1PXV4_9GAMM|nr:Fic family protein [Thiohalospira halophila]SFD14547.1 cell filamentation protein [Thiohalospira halophila DSM 15071]
MDRYSVVGVEGKYEPGSDEAVLANKLSITDPAEMVEVETDLLLQLYEAVLESFPRDEPITVAVIKEWHRRWLGKVYEWAGQERGVNLGKDGFQFANAALVPRLLAEFEQEYLLVSIPCAGMTLEQLVPAIARVHVELVLIHPFREGNGRIARLLADVMAAQAGFGPLQYDAWGSGKPDYIGAIHAGLDGDYEPMEELVRRALDP